MGGVLLVIIKQKQVKKYLMSAVAHANHYLKLKDSAEKLGELTLIEIQGKLLKN